MTLARRVKRILAPALTYLEGRSPMLSGVMEHGRRAAVDLRTLGRIFLPWEKREGQLFSANIETTNICNANCVFCAYRYQSAFRRGKGVMEERIFRKAIDGVIEMGGRFVPLAPMVGEPLIDPNIIQRVQHVLERGLSTSFFTNGILLHKIDLEVLLRTGIGLITLSTAPFDRKAHELIYRTVHYDDLLAGVTRFLELRNRLGSGFVLAMAIKSHVPKREALNLPDFRQEVWPLMTERERRLVGVQTRSYDTWGGADSAGGPRRSDESCPISSYQAPPVQVDLRAHGALGWPSARLCL